MKRKKQPKNWIQWVISLLSVSAILALVGISLWWSDFSLDTRIQQVRFAETTVLNKQIYEATLGDIIGRKPNELNLRDLSELIESHPYVKAARISHQYPRTLQIEIIERQPIALLQTEPMVMLDSEGFVLPDINNLGNFDLPILTNFNSEMDLYPSGQKALSIKVQECIDWLSKIQTNYITLYDNLSEMKMTSSNEMELVLADQSTEIYLGQDNLWERISVLKLFEKKLSPNRISDFSYLDMRFENQIIAKRRRS